MAKALYVHRSEARTMDYQRLIDPMIEVLEAAGAKRVWIEPAYGWSNQPDVVVFTGLSEDQATEALDILLPDDPWGFIVHEADWVKRKRRRKNPATVLWIRLGDYSDYWPYDSIYAAAEDMAEAGVTPPFRRRSGDPFGVYDSGVFTGLNYISIFWGEDDQEPEPEESLTKAQLSDLAAEIEVLLAGD